MTRRASPASVHVGLSENEDGREVAITTATCLEGECEADAYGDGEASTLRALATLTEECSCGASWHYEAQG